MKLGKRNRRFRRIGVALTAWLMVGAGFAHGEDVSLIYAGTLLAVPGEAPLTQQTIIIENDRIRGVRAGYMNAEAVLGPDDHLAAIYDLKDQWVLPGLIDGHVHLTSENNPQGRLQTVQLSDPDRAILAAFYAQKTLMAGFTSVRDVGARGGDAIFALRDGINRGYVPGPRIFAAGSTISITGGHADGTQGYRDDIAEVLHSSGVCNGADDCRKAVREQVRRGADQIKITATGGVLSNTAAGLGKQFSDEELAAIIDAAHAMGRKVTAHAHGVDGINAALKAGIDSIEHGTYLDRASIRLFKRTGAYLVPTILAGVTVTEWANDPNSFLTPPQRAKAKIVGPRMLEMARLAHEGGVKIAFGTDSGVSAHGDNAREFGLLVEAGMTPMEAIKAATVDGADNLGQSANLGTIEVGKKADIVAVKENPLQNIDALLSVSFVMKDGTMFKQE